MRGVQARAINIVIFISAIAFALGMSMAVDRLVGLTQPKIAQHAGLIFPPNMQREFHSSEFAYTVHINSLGFRDREFATQRTPTKRVLALGDSFTYGWGVQLEESWPKVLEANLRAAGCDVEIANLGKPDAYPETYSIIADKAVPLLKPDLVIVAVLQGDDLAQMEPQPRAARRDLTVYSYLQRLTARLWPHLHHMVETTIPDPPLAEQWKRDAAAFIATLSATERTRFEKFDRKIRDAFTSGNLNPGLLWLSLKRPDYYLSTINADAPGTSALIAQMARRLQIIGTAASDNLAKAIVVSVPEGSFASKKSYETAIKLGFEVTPAMLEADVGDEPIRRASQAAGLPFYAVSNDFRGEANRRDLFFELDGHLNAAGHQQFALLLTPIIGSILSAINTDQRSCRSTHQSFGSG